MNRGKMYSISKNDHKRLLSTTQKNILVPTGELIKNKDADMRVVACISAISNTDNLWNKEDKSRYCSIDKLNNNLNDIASATNIKRTRVMTLIQKLEKLGSSEFCVGTEEKSKCIEIKYNNGEFVLLPYEKMEFLVGKLSNNAFKLYLTLLWICRDHVSNKFIEKRITRSVLLDNIGLSKTSTKLLVAAERELLNLGLIEVRTKWECDFTSDLNNKTPVAKKYYKLKVHN